MRMACPNSIIDSQYYQLKFTVRMSAACPTGVLYLFSFKKIRNPGKSQKIRKIPKNLKIPKNSENPKNTENPDSQSRLGTLGLSLDKLGQSLNMGKCT